MAEPNIPELPEDFGGNIPTLPGEDDGVPSLPPGFDLPESGPTIHQPSLFSEAQSAIESGVKPEEMNEAFKKVYGKTFDQVTAIVGPFATMQDISPPVPEEGAAELRPAGLYQLGLPVGLPDEATTFSEGDTPVSELKPKEYFLSRLPGGLYGAVPGLAGGAAKAFAEMAGVEVGKKGAKKRLTLIEDAEKAIKEDLLDRVGMDMYKQIVTDGVQVSEDLFGLFLDTMGSTPPSPKDRAWAEKNPNLGGKGNPSEEFMAQLKHSYDTWEHMVPGMIGLAKAYWDLGSRGAVWRRDEKRPEGVSQLDHTIEGYQAILSRPWTLAMAIAPVLKAVKLRARAHGVTDVAAEMTNKLKSDLNKTIIQTSDIIRAKDMQHRAYAFDKATGVLKDVGTVASQFNKYTYLRGMVYGDVVGGTVTGMSMAMADAFLRQRLPRTRIGAMAADAVMNFVFDARFSTVESIGDNLNLIYDEPRFNQAAIEAEGVRYGKQIEKGEGKLRVVGPKKPGIKIDRGPEPTPQKGVSSRTPPPEAFSKSGAWSHLTKEQRDFIRSFIPKEDMETFVRHLVSRQAELIARADRPVSVRNASGGKLDPWTHDPDMPRTKVSGDWRASLDRTIKNYEAAQRQKSMFDDAASMEYAEFERSEGRVVTSTADRSSVIQKEGWGSMPTEAAQAYKAAQQAEFDLFRAMEGANELRRPEKSILATTLDPIVQEIADAFGGEISILDPLLGEHVPIPSGPKKPGIKIDRGPELTIKTDPSKAQTVAGTELHPEGATWKGGKLGIDAPPPAGGKKAPFDEGAIQRGNKPWAEGIPGASQDVMKAPGAKSKAEWIKRKHQAEKSEAFEGAFGRGGSHLQRGFASELEFHQHHGTLPGYIDDFIVASSKNPKGREIKNRPVDPTGEAHDHAFEPPARGQDLPKMFESPDHPAAVLFKKELIERVGEIAKKVEQPSKAILAEAERLYPKPKPTGGPEMEVKKSGRKRGQGTMFAGDPGNTYFRSDGKIVKSLTQAELSGAPEKITIHKDAKILKEGSKEFQVLVGKDKGGDFVERAVEVAREKDYSVIEFKEHGVEILTKDAIVSVEKVGEKATGAAPAAARSPVSLDGEGVARTKADSTFVSEAEVRAPREMKGKVSGDVSNKSRLNLDDKDPGLKEYIQSKRMQKILHVNEAGEVVLSPTGENFQVIAGRHVTSKVIGGKRVQREGLMDSLKELYALESTFTDSLPIGARGKTLPPTREYRLANRLYLDTLRDNSTMLYHNAGARQSLKLQAAKDVGLSNKAAQRFANNSDVDATVRQFIRDSFKEMGKIEEGKRVQFQDVSIRFEGKTISLTDDAGPAFVRFMQKHSPKELAKIQGAAASTFFEGLARKNAKLTFLRQVGKMIDERSASKIALDMINGKAIPAIDPKVTRQQLRVELDALKTSGRFSEAQKTQAEMMYSRLVETKLDLNQLRKQIQEEVFPGKEPEFLNLAGKWKNGMLVDRQLNWAITAMKQVHSIVDAHIYLKTTMGIHRGMKKSFAMKNPSTVVRNAAQASFMIMMEEGRGISLVGDFYKLARFWKRYLDGEEMSPKDLRRARIFRDSGGHDVDHAVAELGDVFRGHFDDPTATKVGRALGKAGTWAGKISKAGEFPYRAGDAGPRAYKMFKTIDTHINYLERLNPGEYATMAISPNKSVTLFKNKDGTFTMNNRKLSRKQLDKVIGKAAKAPVDLNVFDYGDVPLGQRLLREMPVISSLYPTWITKAAFGNRKSLPISMIDATDGINFITNNKGINIEMSNAAAALSVRRAIFFSFLQSLESDPDKFDMSKLRPLMGFDLSSGVIGSAVMRPESFQGKKTTVKQFGLSSANNMEGLAMVMRIGESMAGLPRYLMELGLNDTQKLKRYDKELAELWDKKGKTKAEITRINNMKAFWARRRMYDPRRDVRTLLALAGGPILDAFAFDMEKRNRLSAYKEDKIQKMMWKGLLTGYIEPIREYLFVNRKEFVDRPFDDYRMTPSKHMVDQITGVAFKTAVYGGDKDAARYNKKQIIESLNASITVAARKREKEAEKHLVKAKRSKKSALLENARTPGKNDISKFDKRIEDARTLLKTKQQIHQHAQRYVAALDRYWEERLQDFYKELRTKTMGKYGSGRERSRRPDRIKNVGAPKQGIRIER